MLSVETATYNKNGKNVRVADDTDRRTDTMERTEVYINLDEAKPPRFLPAKLLATLNTSLSRTEDRF